MAAKTTGLAGDRAGLKLSGDPTMARRVNDRLALDLLAQYVTLTRTQLRRLMGVSQPTILEIVKRLEDDGWISAVGSAPDTRPGPRPVLYGIVPGRAVVAGVRVRDNEIVAALADVSGGPPQGIVSMSAGPTDLPDQVSNAVRAAFDSCDLAPELLTHVVVGVPGIVDRRTGDLGFSWDHPSWRARLLAPLQERFACPVELSGGVQLVAVAEGQMLHDEGQYALVWVGTGVGLCLVIDGHPFWGYSGAAGQIGYMPVPGAPVLPVRKTDGSFSGDLQALVGAPALLDLAHERGIEASTAIEAIEAAGSTPDPKHDGYLDETAKRIATGLAAVTAVIDPGLFVLQGETALAGGQRLAELVERHLSELSPIDARVVLGGIFDRDPEVEGGLLVARTAVRQALWGGLDLPRSATPYGELATAGVTANGLSH